MASIGLNVGLKALLAAKSGLDTVGHNISNANTPGYSRQSLLLSASPALKLHGLAIGNGVQADNILRTADLLLNRRLVAQGSSLSALDTRLVGMSQVEAFFGEPGENGLSALMQGFFSSISKLTSSPGDAVLRGGAVQASTSLADRFRDLSSNLDVVRKDAAAQVGVQVSQVNELTKHILSLNHQIASFENGGLAANDLRDQRDLALSELSKLVDISYHEGQNGYVTVTTNGALLIGANHAYAMSATANLDGEVTIRVEGNDEPIDVRGGSIGGLVQLGADVVPGLAAKLDLVAHQLILDVNRAHTTGIPADGPFKTLTGLNAITDTDGDGVVSDQLLSQSGLPFDVAQGALYVNVSQSSTGAFTTTRIDIDPDDTTVGELIDALNQVAHIDAGLDATGHLKINADQGYGFDFSRRVQTQPDAQGTFGSNAATLGTAAAGPFNLADGDTLAITGPTGPIAITIDGSDFADVTQATASELASALNGDPALAAGGMEAVAVGGHLVLRSLTSGASESFTLTGGSALAALGWSAGTTTAGQANTVGVTLSGTYSGDANETYTFVPSMDGTIGTTAGLKIDVFDADGDQVASLDVGAGYTPGAKLALGNGLEAAFSFGEVSASDNDVLTFDALADSDTSDALVALGLNVLFTGSDAHDIGVRDDIELDYDKLALSATGGAGDNGIVLDLIAASQHGADALGGSTTSSFYGELVSGLGFQIDSTRNARDVDQFLMDSLTSQRDQIAGVNVDEELVDMIQFEQAFGAAAKYIQTVNSTNDELMQLI